MTVFISYSHDSEKHRAWVVKLASDLRLKGIRVVFDQVQLKIGDSLTTFMEEHIEHADYVLVICTDTYIQKAKDKIGGVGYEMKLIASEIYQNQKTNKFIPIVRDVQREAKTPPCLRDFVYCDFSKGQDYGIQLTTLVERIVGEDILQEVDGRDDIETEGEGWSAVVDGEKILLNRGVPKTINVEGRAEKYLVIDDDVLCVEQVFANGMNVYYEVDKDGNMLSQSLPFPLMEYNLVISKDLLVEVKSSEADNGLIRYEAKLKWGRNCSWILDAEGKLSSYSIQGGASIDHFKKVVIVR